MLFYPFQVAGPLKLPPSMQSPIKRIPKNTKPDGVEGSEFKDMERPTKRPATSNSKTNTTKKNPPTLKAHKIGKGKKSSGRQGEKEPVEKPVWVSDVAELCQKKKTDWSQIDGVRKQKNVDEQESTAEGSGNAKRKKSTSMM